MTLGTPVLRPEGNPNRLQVFSALRHPNFRLYWLGMVVSITGFNIQQIGVQWLVYRLTESSLQLGLVSLATGVPTILLTLFGGVLADRVDRRRLLLYTQAVMTVNLFVLAVLTTTGLIQVWHIMVIAFLNGAVQAFHQPSRQALVPHLIEREDLMNAVALVSVVWQASRIIGPYIAGIVVATMGEGMCFYIASFGYLAMVIALFLVQVAAVQGRGRGSMWGGLGAGGSF